MIRKFFYLITAFLGVLICGYGGMNISLAVLRWERTLRPSGPSWGIDLVSPTFALGGFLSGTAVGSFLLFYIGRRYLPPPQPSPKRDPKTPTGLQPLVSVNRLYFIISALAALLFLGQSAYFSIWKEGWTIAVTGNLIAPLLATMAVGWWVQSRRIEFRIVWVATILICAILIYFHLPQTADLNSIRPKLSYVVGLLICCILQWGVWTIASSVIVGLRFSGKHRIQEVERKEPLEPKQSGLIQAGERGA